MQTAVSHGCQASAWIIPMNRSAEMLSFLKRCLAVGATAIPCVRAPCCAAYDTEVERSGWVKLHAAQGFVTEVSSHPIAELPEFFRRVGRCDYIMVRV